MTHLASYPGNFRRLLRLDRKAERKEHGATGKARSQLRPGNWSVGVLE